MRKIILHALAALLLPAQLLAGSIEDSNAIKQAAIKKLYEQYQTEFTAFQAKQGHYIQTPNVKMHYVTYGKPSGVPIIWSHGTYGTALEMYVVADSLVKAGYYIIAIEYYGHGLTPSPDKELSLWHVADDIRYLMDELKIKKAVIGGFSRGGSVSTVFYDQYPERVMALILEDGGSVAWNTNRHRLPIDSAIKEIYSSFHESRPDEYDTPLDAFTRLYNNNSQRTDFKRLAFSFFSRITQNRSGKWVMFNPDLEDLLYQNTPERSIQISYRTLSVTGRGMFDASTALVNPKIIYRNLDVPMLIFDPVNKDDVFNFEDDNRALQKSHPEFITHLVYPNTGHAVKYEHPAEFCRDVTTFLAKALKRK